MKNVDTFECFVSGYYGIRDYIDYELKPFVLKDIENYIRELIKEKPHHENDYQKSSDMIEHDLSGIQKLQDSLIVLRKIEGYMDLVLIIKRKIKELRYEEFINSRKLN